MKRHAAELLTRDPERFFHHDRVFLNNPVVMQGMGLAPLVVLATSGQNALMLAVAVALLLTVLSLELYAIRMLAAGLVLLALLACW